MWKLGLTGSIASGKSTALREFEALGVPTFSSDDAVHQLYRGEAVPAQHGRGAALAAVGSGAVHRGADHEPVHAADRVSARRRGPFEPLA